MKKHHRITMETYKKTFVDSVNLYKRSDIELNFIDKILSIIDINWVIFEIWSYIWEDSIYIYNKWYNIIATDNFDESINFMRNKFYEKFDIEIKKFDLNYDIDNLYEIVKLYWIKTIIAKQVFQHFNEKELLNIISSIYQNLEAWSVLAFTLEHRPLTDNYKTTFYWTEIWMKRFAFHHNRRKLNQIISKQWRKILYEEFAEFAHNDYQQLVILKKI